MTRAEIISKNECFMIMGLAWDRDRSCQLDSMGQNGQGSLVDIHFHADAGEPATDPNCRASFTSFSPLEVKRST